MSARVFAVGALFLAASSWAEYGFPDAVKFPAELQLDVDQQLVHEDVAEAEFAIDQKRTLACAVHLDGQYGHKGLYIGVPCQIGKDGAEKVLEIELNAEEKALLNSSAAAVKELVEASAKL